MWASHQFGDVPTDHPFHADIDWMVDHGITNGYHDGTFRPTAPVSRQAAAAFLHRYNDELELREWTDSVPAGNSSLLRTVACPEGKRGVAAGGRANTPDIVAAGSSPLSGGDGRTWEVYFTRRDAALAPPATTIRVWLLCRPG